MVTFGGKKGFRFLFRLIVETTEDTVPHLRVKTLLGSLAQAIVDLENNQLPYNT